MAVKVRQHKGVWWLFIQVMIHTSFALYTFLYVSIGTRQVRLSRILYKWRRLVEENFRGF
jgi:hypothetical protein